LPEITLLALAADVGITKCLLDCFLRRAMQLALGKKKTGRPFQRFSASSPALSTSFYSRHV
jgi:hypothetical protein